MDARIPTAKKSVTYNSAFTHNILSLCDNGSYKLPFNDAAEFGNSAERKQATIDRARKFGRTKREGIFKIDLSKSEGTMK